MENRENTRERLWLTAGLTILATATVLRFYCIDHGLPTSPDVDASKWVDEAGRMAKLGDWRPTTFQYPTFFTYILAGLYRVLPITSAYAQHVIARVVSAIFGVGMVACAWPLGRRVGGPLTSAVATCLVAFSVVCVTSSRMAATDTMTACFVTAALCCLVRQPLRQRDTIAAGVFVGLAAGTKFSGGVAMATVWMAAAHLGWTTGRWRRAATHAFAATVAGGIAFLAVTPAFIPRIQDYASGIRLVAVIEGSGQLGHVQFGWFDYFISLTPTCEQPWQGTSLLADVGPFVLLLITIALAMAFSRRVGFPRLLLATHCAVFFLVVTGPGHIKAIRFILPALPALFVLVGWVVELGADTLTRRAPSFRAPAILGAVALTIVWPVWHVFPYVVSEGRQSTHALARQWLIEHLPAGARVVIWPLFDDDLTSMPYSFLRIENYGSKQYNVPVNVGVSPERQPIFSPELIDSLLTEPMPYVIVNSYAGNQFAPTPENRRWFPISVDHYARTMERLESSSDRLYGLHGWSERRPGPDITIYRLRSARDR